MKNRNLFLLVVVIEILSIASALAFYIYSNQGIDIPAKNSHSSVYIRYVSNVSILAEDLNKSAFAINDSEIVIKNLTISINGLSSDEKIIRLRALYDELPSFAWLNDDEKNQIRSLINSQTLELQQNSDYHQIPEKIVIGNQSIKITNGSDYYTIEMAKKTLALFPSYNIEGIEEVNFTETPINNKTGQHYPMYYLDGKIIVRSSDDANWVTENGDTFQQKLAHEVGHNIIDQKIADSADLKRFSVLHGDVSSSENFLTKYAKEEKFEEDFSESISFWRGNTRLFCKISRRNSVMQEKFLITAKQFCRNDLCTAYISSEAKEESSGNFTAKENIYRGLFWYDLKSQNIKIENSENFSEFAEKLDCK